MNAYRTTHSLATTEAAYIAGLVDGEGTVTLSRKHRSENRQLAVTISNTEIRLLEYVLRTIGAGKITGKRTVSERHTPSFSYAIYNQQALRLLEQISPYLRTYKAERTSIILQEYRALTPRNGKYTDRQRLLRTDFEQRVLGTKPTSSKTPMR